MRSVGVGYKEGHMQVFSECTFRISVDRTLGPLKFILKDKLSPLTANMLKVTECLIISLDTVAKVWLV